MAACAFLNLYTGTTQLGSPVDSLITQRKKHTKTRTDANLQFAHAAKT